MFRVEYLLALVKLLFQMGFSIVTALFFKPCWNCVASNYLADYIPNQFVTIPYWHMVALLFTVVIIGECIQKLTPKIISVKQSNDNKSDDKND